MGTIEGTQFCRNCGATFDNNEHQRKMCTNCIKEVCSACVAMVRLQSYGETAARVMCGPCVEDVKRKIITWKSVGRGTGQQEPPAGAHARRGSVSFGRGRERAPSLTNRGTAGRGSGSNSANSSPLTTPNTERKG